MYRVTPINVPGFTNHSLEVATGMLHQRRLFAHAAVLLQFLICCVLFSACGGSAHSGTLAPSPSILAPDGNNGNPADKLSIPLPQDPYVSPAEIEARQASYSETRTALGDDFFLKSNNTSLDFVNHFLLLKPGRNAYSYGMYRFDTLTMQDMPLQITVTIADPTPTKFYIGITDYQRGRWVWAAVDTPLTVNTVGVPSGLTPVNSGGVTYVTVVAYDRQPTTIISTAITVNIAAPPPLNLDASDGTSGSTVHVSWSDLATSYPGLVYESVLIERAATATGPWTQIGSAPSGVSNYDDVDTKTNDYPYNLPMYYRATTIVAGNPGLPCPPTTGYRRLANVSGLSATDGLYDDKVVLTWNPVVDADGYDLYFINTGSGYPMGWTILYHVEGGATTSFDHTSTFPSHAECLANQVYNYHATATYLTDESLTYSNDDTGYRNTPPLVDLQATPASGNPPLIVDFDASGSSDPDGGSIALYEWDFDGDGTYDFNGASPTVQHVYDKQGVFTAGLRITDNENSTATATKQISVSGWAHSWGTSAGEILRATALDISGQIFAVGDEDDGTQSDVLLVKYDTNGSLVWHKTWGDNGANDHATSLAVDFAGNVFIAGFTDSYGEGGEDMLLLKYNSSGTLLWQKTWGEASNERALGITAGGTGDVFLVGFSNSFSMAGSDVAIVQFSGGGSVTLQKVWDGGSIESATCAISDASSLYIGGYTDSFGAGASDALLLSLDNLGNLQLQKVWGGSGEDRALAIELSGTDVYLSGSTASYGAGGVDGLLLKYTTAGGLLWQKTWGGTADETLASLALDSGGNVFLAGESGSVNPGDVYAALLKLDNTGAFMYDKAWHSGTTSRALGLVLNFAGSAVLAGQAVNSASGVWSVPGEALADVTGTGSDVTGTLSNVSGVMADVTGTEDSPAGTVDTGGGSFDSLVLKLGPG
jgi:hypothetical protein